MSLWRPCRRCLVTLSESLELWDEEGFIDLWHVLHLFKGASSWGVTLLLSLTDFSLWQNLQLSYQKDITAFCCKLLLYSVEYIYFFHFLGPQTLKMGGINNWLRKINPRRKYFFWDNNPGFSMLTCGGRRKWKMPLFQGKAEEHLVFH